MRAGIFVFPPERVSWLNRADAIVWGWDGRWNAMTIGLSPLERGELERCVVVPLYGAVETRLVNLLMTMMFAHEAAIGTTRGIDFPFMHSSQLGPMSPISGFSLIWYHTRFLREIFSDGFRGMVSLVRRMNSQHHNSVNKPAAVGRAEIS